MSQLPGRVLRGLLFSAIMLALFSFPALAKGVRALVRKPTQPAPSAMPAALPARGRDRPRVTPDTRAIRQRLQRWAATR